MSIGLTRLNTSKAFHGAASSVSRIFRSHAHTHNTLFEISVNALHILNCDFFLFACRVIFNPISKATSQFFNLQKIASIVAAKLVSKQSQRTPINPICQSCCLSYLELALSLSIARKHVFFVLFLFLKWEANMGLRRGEEREEEGGPTKQK